MRSATPLLADVRPARDGVRDGVERRTARVARRDATPPPCERVDGPRQLGVARVARSVRCDRSDRGGAPRGRASEGAGARRVLAPTAPTSVRSGRRGPRGDRSRSKEGVEPQPLSGPTEGLRPKRSAPRAADDRVVDRHRNRAAERASGTCDTPLARRRKCRRSARIRCGSQWTEDLVRAWSVEGERARGNASRPGAADAPGLASRVLVHAP